MEAHPGSVALSDPLPRPHPKAAARIISGEAMILTPDGVLHTLNGTATRIWELLGARPSAAHLLDAFQEEYEVERDRLEADVAGLLRTLLEQGVLENDDL